MEVGLCGAVRQGPVTFAAIGGFDNCSEGDVECFRGWEQVSWQSRFKQEAGRVGLADDLRGRGRGETHVALPVVGKAIVGPLQGGREVEFSVFLAVDRSNEGFAAGVLPQTIGSRGRLFDG